MANLAAISAGRELEKLRDAQNELDRARKTLARSIRRALQRDEKQSLADSLEVDISDLPLSNRESIERFINDLQA